MALMPPQPYLYCSSSLFSRLFLDRYITEELAAFQIKKVSISYCAKIMYFWQ